jgi:hypothetical protein
VAFRLAGSHVEQGETMELSTEPDHTQQPVPRQRGTSAARTSPPGPGDGRRLRGSRVLTVLLATTVLALSWGAGVAQAAPANPSAPAPPATPPGVGVDVSYPQCHRPLPSDQAFALVGVNGGTAADTNPCLASELAWAAKSVGGTVHDPVQLYVNTGNPSGGPRWPQAGSTRYGDCDGSNSRPCAYRYGWERAREDATGRGVQRPEQYMWWLDVELANTWDYSDGGGTRNAAVLEGMTDYFHSIHTRGVGLYSSRHQWDVIIGSGVDSTSSLNGLSNWRPTGNSLERARANCRLAPLTPGGVIEMTQYTTDHDYNVSCI